MADKARRFEWQQLGDWQVRTAHADKALVAGAILYIITPIDLIPDFAPFAGFLDDLGVAAYALAYINSRLNQIETSKLIESEISETDKDNMQNT